VFLLGAAYYAAGNYLLAQRMFEAGAQYPGMLPEAYANLGAIALKEGKPKEALFFLSRAAKRRPHKAQVRYNHALALRALERHADALNELRAAQAADPNDAGVHFLAGVVALRLGLLVEAERDFREALRLDPQHDDARHNLALLEPVVHPRQEGAVSTFEGPVPFAPVPPPGTAPAPRGEPGK
jgi:Flp pilus assembly protein TadD